MFSLVTFIPAASQAPAASKPAPPHVSPAVNADPGKIAVINFQGAVVQTVEGKRLLAEIQKKYEPQKAQIAAQKDEIDSLTRQLQTYGGGLSDGERASRAKTLEDKKEHLQRSAEDAEKAFQNDAQQAFNALAGKVNEVLSGYAQKHGFVLVVDIGPEGQNVLLYKASLLNTTDITQDVADAYDSRPEATSAPAPPDASSLDGKVVFTVLATRSWAPPDAKFLLLAKVPDDSYYYLQMDGLVIGGGPSALLTDEGSADQQQALQTGATFTRRCVKVSPPMGKYLEVLLTLKNNSGQTEDQTISDETPGELNFALTPAGGSPVHPIDFLAPGFSTSQFAQLQSLQTRGLTVVSEFTGRLSAHLDAGGSTWVLLLFDVPKGATSAKLQIGDLAPVSVRF